MHKLLICLCTLSMVTPLAFGACQVTTHIEPAKNWSPRKIESQTHQSVIRDYLEAWKSMRAAFAANNSGLLEKDFVGTAKDKLAASIQGQAKAGLATDYCDSSHDLQIVFYSPEGLSIQLVDKVDYRMRVLRKGKLLATRQMRARYLAVLTPSATRWMVRIFQAEPQSP